MKQYRTLKSEPEEHEIDVWTKQNKPESKEKFLWFLKTNKQSLIKRWKMTIIKIAMIQW